jgi:hypothetical protein
MGAAMGAGAAANFLGSVMQMLAAKKAEQEMFNTYKDYQQQGAKFQKRGMQEFNAALPAYSAPAQSRMPWYQQVRDIPMDYGAPMNRADTASYDMMAGNRATLNQFGDSDFMRSIQLGKTGRGLDMLSVLAGNRMGVMPYSMYKAADALKMGGQMLSSLGGSSTNVASMFGSPSGGTGYSMQTEGVMG